MSEDLPNRQSIRLRGFDYTNQGYYFVTICTHGREKLFGEILGGKMILNECGVIVAGLINQTPTTDIYVIMPNHIHTIVNVGAGFPRPKNNKEKRGVENMFVGAGFPRPKNNIHGNNTLDIGRENLAPTLGMVIAYLKYQSSKEFNKTHLLLKKLWQRNYYEHIIRNETELWQARTYIENNVTNWESDTLRM